MKYKEEIKKYSIFDETKDDIMKKQALKFPEENLFQHADSNNRTSLIAQGYSITDEDSKVLFWEVFDCVTFEAPAVSDHIDDSEVEHKTDLEKFEFYLNAGANPNIKTSYRRLPKVNSPILSIAVWYGLFDLVALLIKYKAKIEAKSATGWTAWMYAKQLEKTKIVELLEKNNAKKHDLSTQAFIKSAEQQDITAVKEWLNQGVDINLLDEKGETALYKSVSKTDDYTCAKVLLEARARTNIQYHGSAYKTILERVVMNVSNDKKENEAFVQQLLPLVNKKQHIGGFYQAVSSQQYEIAEMIFQSMDSIFKPKLLEFQQLLQKACFTGDLQMLDYIIEKGADLDQNTTEHFRETPLTLAISKHHFELVKRLLDAGADPNFRNGVELTPLEICALRSKEHKIDIGVLLLKNGADMLVKNKNKRTILSTYDFEKDFATTIKLAIDKG